MGSQLCRVDGGQLATPIAMATVASTGWVAACLATQQPRRWLLVASTDIVAVPLASRSAVQWPACASHYCSAAHQAGHSPRTAQPGSHTGHTELAGQPHGSAPYLWPAAPLARTDRLESPARTVQSASRGARKWTVWLDLQDERRGRSSGHCMMLSCGTERVWGPPAGP